MTNIYTVQLRDKFQEISENRMGRMGDYINVFDSTYFLYTKMPAKDIYENLTIEHEFNILIMKCDPSDYYGYLNKKVWEWLNERK